MLKFFFKAIKPKKKGEEKEAFDIDDATGIARFYG